METPLLTWPTGDQFCVEDLVRSIFVYGKTGSGKSSGSGLALMRAILAVGAGVLFLCSKPEDRAWITKLAAQAGRSQDVIVFAADTAAKCNFIDVQMQEGEDARGITDFMVNMKEVVSKSTKDKGDQFWELSAQDEFMYSIEPLRLAYKRVTAHDIREFISSSPKSRADLEKADTDASRSYRAGFHCRTMKQARQNISSQIEKWDFDACASFWNGHYVALDSKPRSSIEAGMMTTLNVFSMGLVRSKVSDSTSVSPADLDQGKIIVVDFCVSSYSASGKVIMAGWKYIVEKHVLRRKFEPGQKLVIIYSDECQNLINTQDRTYIDECRSHGGGLVFLTQSISNYRDALGEEGANALTGQPGHSVFHVVDPITAKFASEMVGSAMQSTYGGNEQPSTDFKDHLNGNAGWVGSMNEGVRPLIEPREFTIGRTGGKRNRRLVDSYVVRSGQLFRGESSCIKVTWSQV